MGIDRPSGSLPTGHRDKDENENELKAFAQEESNETDNQDDVDTIDE